MKTQYEILKYNPCKEAIEFRSKFNSFKEAWEQCPRGDWMLWIASELEIDLRTLTLTKALCANTVRHLMPTAGKRAVLMAIKFARNKATSEELKEAAYAAAEVAEAAYAAYTAAAYAAAYAAAAAAAYATAYDYAAATDAAKTKNQMKTADICRKYLTKSVFEKLKI